MREEKKGDIEGKQAWDVVDISVTAAVQPSKRSGIELMEADAE